MSRRQKSEVEATLDELSKELGGAHGQIVTAIVKRRVSPTVIRNIKEQIEKSLEKSKDLLHVLEGQR